MNRASIRRVKQLCAELGIDDLTFVGVAKGPDRNAGRETFYHPDGREFTLPPNNAVLFYIQRLRDEAHRFAIGAHRQKRAKAMGHATSSCSGASISARRGGNPSSCAKA